MAIHFRRKINYKQCTNHNGRAVEFYEFAWSYSTGNSLSLSDEFQKNETNYSVVKPTLTKDFKSSIVIIVESSISLPLKPNCTIRNDDYSWWWWCIRITIRAKHGVLWLKLHHNTHTEPSLPREWHFSCWHRLTPWLAQWPNGKCWFTHTVQFRFQLILLAVRSFFVSFSKEKETNTEI